MVEKIKQALERAYLERENAETSMSELLGNAIYYEIDPAQLTENRIIAFEDTDSNIESYRLFRAQILRKFDTDKIVSLGITSANVAEGKSITALNLAISLAKTADVNIILIDADLTHPSIHKLLNIHPKHGLIELLNGKVKLEDVIVRTDISNLWIVPGRLNQGEVLEQARLSRIEKLINNLSDGNGNIVIVDLPPILAKDDTISIAEYLHSTILVVENGKTTSDEVSRSAALLKHNNLIGCVLNKYGHYQVKPY